MNGHLYDQTRLYSELANLRSKESKNEGDISIQEEIPEIAEYGKINMI